MDGEPVSDGAAGMVVEVGMVLVGVQVGTEPVGMEPVGMEPVGVQTVGVMDTGVDGMEPLAGEPDGEVITDGMVQVVMEEDGIDQVERIIITIISSFIFICKVDIVY